MTLSIHLGWLPCSVQVYRKSIYINYILVNGMHIQDRPVDCTYMYVCVCCFLREKHAHFVFTTSLLSKFCTFSAAFSLAFSALRNFSCSFFCAACASSSLDNAARCNQFGLTFGLVKKLLVTCHLFFLVGKPSFERPEN